MSSWCASPSPNHPGRATRLLVQSSIRPAPESPPWRGDIKGRPKGGHPAERGRKRRQIEENFPSSLPVLLPLEKGLGALAFAPDHSNKRTGQRRSRAFRGSASRTRMRCRGAPQGYDLRPLFTNRATDSWPRRRAGSSAEARPARRLFPSPFWPVKKGTPRRRSQHQPSIPLPFYPPCPSLSREGTWA